MKVIALALISLLLHGCASSLSNRVNDDDNLFLKGTVLKVQGNEAEIAVTYPEPPASSDSVVTELAQKVISKTVFVEGGRTEINGASVTIGKVGKAGLVVTTEQGAGFAQGNSVKVTVPKKHLAVVDFEVINTPSKDMGRILQESLTSELVESGQFIILERAKLKSVLDEIKLSQSGLTQESSEVMAGKIINADFILTGTLADIGGVWNVNLRIVNVRTSQAIASITHKSPLFKPADLRDPSPLSEDFEENYFPSWNLGYHNSWEDHFKVSIDRSTGAEKSTSSIRVDFDIIKNMNFFANAASHLKRDLSHFKGVEFYVKGTEGFNAYVSFLSSQPVDQNNINNYVANFEITPEWRKVRISFDSFTIGRNWIKGGAKQFGAVAGDQLLRLNRIEAVRVGFLRKHIPLQKGTFWIDKISFYR